MVVTLSSLLVIAGLQIERASVVFKNHTIQEHNNALSFVRTRVLYECIIMQEISKELSNGGCQQLHWL
jgi:hypothetical protein